MVRTTVVAVDFEALELLKKKAEKWDLVMAVYKENEDDYKAIVDIIHRLKDLTNVQDKRS